MMSKRRYDKEAVEVECLKSAENGIITEELGKYILARCTELAGANFDTSGNHELRQALIDAAVLRICEKFLDYYTPGRSGANLVISMAISTMINKIKSLAWADIYGEKQKSYIVVFQEGEWKRVLTKVKRDDNASRSL